MKRNLTQKQLTCIAGVAASTIHSYESGNRYPSYGVLINYLTDYPVFHLLK
ncbi:helix-turn-helix domain-containing protein [Frisingicoccus caecimuris]|uniref:helix-turn-helix domain-containing protein n=1 Tax=Frisingicoccus caecimuris TaxID=1796636 RepID=UPI00214C65AE|nr:helix-turn-helix transcriptional regulator [Frisingicoccus caecimuris]MCR1919364.1 helix-turn-helix domain-containing protein [Frisingicoccus caecimuris]